MAKFKRSELVKLFKEIGSDTADKWPVERLQTKIGKLKAQLEKDKKEPTTADSKALLKKVLAAVVAEEEITIKDDGAKGAAPAPAPEPAKEKKPKTPPPATDTDDDDDDEEPVTKDDDDDDDEETEAPTPDDDDDDEDAKPAAKEEKTEKKKGPPKSAGGDGKPGVIASIIEFLLGATEEKPLSKDKMADKLAKRFPDRDRESMKRTINVQVPNRIKKDKGVEVKKNDKGYWFGPDAAKKLAAKKKEAKPAPAPVAADEDDD